MLPQEMRAKGILSSCQSLAIPSYELCHSEVRDGEQPQGHDSFKIWLIIPATSLGIKSRSWMSLGRRIFLCIWLPEDSPYRPGKLQGVTLWKPLIFRTSSQFVTDLCFLFFLQGWLRAVNPKAGGRCQSCEQPLEFAGKLLGEFLGST